MTKATITADMQTVVLTTGLPEQVLEGFAQYVSDIHSTNYKVVAGEKQRGKLQNFQVCFEKDLTFNHVFGIKRALHNMGATTAHQTTFH
jgi:hypothetical protein